jgi:hypothetical protein
MVNSHSTPTRLRGQSGAVVWPLGDQEMGEPETMEGYGRQDDLWNLALR